MDALNIYQIACPDSMEVGRTLRLLANSLVYWDASSAEQIYQAVLSFYRQHRGFSEWLAVSIDLSEFYLHCGNIDKAMETVLSSELNSMDRERFDANLNEAFSWFNICMLVARAALLLAKCQAHYCDHAAAVDTLIKRYI